MPPVTIFGLPGCAVNWAAKSLTICTSHTCNVKLGGFGGLEVACWPLVHKFAASNPAEAVRFFRTKKSSARLPSEGK